VMESSWRFSHPPILPGLGRPRHGTPACPRSTDEPRRLIRE
jgi:hypothetical protein